MNAKQSLKIVSKDLADKEIVLARAMKDIARYNLCIDSVIAGEKTFCDWCEEQNECQLEAKGKGCDVWWLKYEEDQNEKADQAEG